jgi:hypothetical protein
MNKLLILICLATTPVWAQSRLVFAWKTNPADAAAWPPCNRFVVRTCRTGYSLTEVTTASAPVLISSTIAADALTYTLSPLPSAGLHIYHLVVAGKGSSGTPVQSAPATISVKVPSPASHIHRLVASVGDQSGTSGSLISTTDAVIAGGAP